MLSLNLNFARFSARDCADVLYQIPEASSGVYNLYLTGHMVAAYCDMNTDGGGWTVRECYIYFSLFLSMR